MTNWSTYITFGAPVVGIVIGYGVLSFLRVAGQWASQERAQVHALSPKTVYHAHVAPTGLSSARFVAADAARTAILMRTLASSRRNEEAPAQAELPLVQRMTG
jgi:hypothetical protein